MVRLLTVTLLVLILVGCGRPKTRLTEDEARNIAIEYAFENLSNDTRYWPTAIRFQKDVWRVRFEMKPPLPGHHFEVTVEDATGKTSSVAGE